MRAVGLDLGTRRIGVAVSDSDGRVAAPHTVVTRSGDPDADRRALARIVGELGGQVVVVGLPVSLDGRESHAARAARAEAEALGAVVGVPVELCDERFTTVVAQRSLRGGGVKAAARRQAVDDVAAAVMLQSWLDQGR